MQLPPHPRLLLLAGEENELKRAIAAEPAYGRLHAGIVQTSDTLLRKPVLQRIQTGRRLLSVSREALRRVFFLAYAYRITGHEKYLKRAEQELLAVAAFSDWNPTHFLDVAEMTLAVALGYDWLYAALPAASRNAIEQAIVGKGLKPSLDTRYNGWLRASHNWNQVCNAGMAFGALAVEETAPELSRTVLNRAIESIKLPMHNYQPDGAYPEGYSYWGYGTGFNVLLIAALEKACGTDFGLSQQPGFLKTAGYMLHMTGPTGRSFNYSDAGTAAELQPAMFWFAQKTKDASLLWAERQRLEGTLLRQDLNNRLLPAVLLWGSGIGLSQMAAPRLTGWSGDGKNPVALLRSSFTDPNALFVGLKSGSPSVSHGHMDVGSFVVDAEGERWAMDLGMQNYESLESQRLDLWNMSQHSQRWEIFRYNNLAHNTLTANGQLQNVQGRAVLSGISLQKDFMAAQTDLTPLYTPLLKTARRGVAIVNAQEVVVRDELSGNGATVRWTLVTPAQPTFNADGSVTLRQHGKTLHVLIEAPQRVQWQAWPTTPLQPYDAPNPGTTRIGFEWPAGAATDVQVRFIPEKNLSKPRPAAGPLSTWPQGR